MVNALSENFLFYTLSALSLMITSYYALTGIACAVYYRRELRRSVKNLIFIGIAPLTGAAILAYLFVKATIDLAAVENSYSGQSVLGMGVPLAIALGFFLLGAVLLVAWRLAGSERFFGRRAFEAVEPGAGTGVSRT
ncbi:MAG: hypothetical protein H0W16_02805 [Actinobacteria bacterium]|nr:hypothetical protein [Actinomycetota bacterium]